MGFWLRGGLAQKGENPPGLGMPGRCSSIRAFPNGRRGDMLRSFHKEEKKGGKGRRKKSGTKLRSVNFPSLTSSYFPTVLLRSRAPGGGSAGALRNPPPRAGWTVACAGGAPWPQCWAGRTAAGPGVRAAAALRGSCCWLLWNESG